MRQRVSALDFSVPRVCACFALLAHTSNTVDFLNARKPIYFTSLTRSVFIEFSLLACQNFPFSFILWYLPISLRHHHDNYHPCGFNLVGMLMVLNVGFILYGLSLLTFYRSWLVGIYARANYFNVFLSISTMALWYLRINLIFPST
jgi:hypothetical protein